MTPVLGTLLPSQVSAHRSCLLLPPAPSRYRSDRQGLGPNPGTALNVHRSPCVLVHISDSTSLRCLDSAFLTSSQVVPILGVSKDGMVSDLVTLAFFLWAPGHLD